MAADNVGEGNKGEGTVMERWTSEHSVDGQLEELVDLFNTSFLSGSPGCMRYQRGRMPVSGELVCQAVHSDDADPVHKMLRERFSWADGRPLAAEYVVFLRFLQRRIPRQASLARTVPHPNGWKEAEGPIAILWKHLVTSKASAVTATDADEGLQFLDLPATHGLQWHFTRRMGLTRFPGRLIVRDFYPMAVASVRRRLHSWADACRMPAATGSAKRGKFQRTFLIGNAGVGKSYFLGFLLLQMAIDKHFLPSGHTLMFVIGSRQTMFELCRDGSSRMRPYDHTVMCDYGFREDIVWLFDPMEAGTSGAVNFSAIVPDMHGHLIMAVSTNMRHWDDNGKDGNPLVSSLFFPDYTEASAKVVFDGLLPSDASDERGSFADRFSVAGGDLRCLLDVTLPTQLMEGIAARKGFQTGLSQLLRFAHAHKGQTASLAEVWDLASTSSCLLTVNAFVAGAAGSTSAPRGCTGAGAGGAGAGASTVTTAASRAAESDAHLVEARGVMPTVWRIAFRSSSAETAIVNAILDMRDKHIVAVLLCEHLDSNLRGVVFEADLMRRLRTHGVTFRWRWLACPDGRGGKDETPADFEFTDLGAITIPPQHQGLADTTISRAGGAPEDLRHYVQTEMGSLCSTVADNHSVMFGLKKCFPAVDSALLVHPTVFRGIINFSNKVKYVALLLQTTVNGRHKLMIVGLTICGYVMGVVSQYAFDLMGNPTSLKEWVKTKGKRPLQVDPVSGSQEKRVVFDALVVATVVPAQPRYKHFKAQQYTDAVGRIINNLPDWLRELPQIILYDMATGVPTATPKAMPGPTPAHEADAASSNEDITM